MYMGNTFHIVCETTLGKDHPPCIWGILKDPCYTAIFESVHRHFSLVCIEDPN